VDPRAWPCCSSGFIPRTQRSAGYRRDFEHERREEVIRISMKVQRERAALGGPPSSYLPQRSAGCRQGMGLDLAQVDKLRGACHGGGAAHRFPDRIRAPASIPKTRDCAPHRAHGGNSGLSTQSLAALWAASSSRADVWNEIVPIANAPMPDRTVIEGTRTISDAWGC